ncbi:ABC transporter substrate-binding protein [Hahella sp. CCB-MM4]|uniref:substrate-binding periplasmic protein n=1 Tax=Hahella sp. (strain CCB-MM4) TaxID=1926491 RepID=UPI00143D7EAD|nr:ABC transporter substrate-binding protein [Hahella sp. CCB-MM4]
MLNNKFAGPMTLIGRLPAALNFIFVTLILGFAGSTQAQSEQLDIYTENYPPYNFLVNDQLTGFSTEIVREILYRIHLPNKEISVLPWARAYNYLKNRDNVMLFTTARTAQRQYLFKWVGPIASREVYLYKLKKSAKVVVDSFEDAKKYMTTAVRDSATANQLMAMGFREGKNLELIHNEDLSFAKFIYGRAQLINKVPMAMAMELKKYDMTMDQVIPLIPLDTGTFYYLAFSLGTDDEIIREWQAALDEMKQDGTYHKLQQKYLQ